MSEPTPDTSVTPNLALPILFPGQAQKEFFVNEAHFLIDALLHLSIRGIGNQPAASPEPGELWLIGSNPEGDWANREDQLAYWTGAQWLYINPTAGMRLYRMDEGYFLTFETHWKTALAPTLPVGGQTIDTEARAALAALVQSLQDTGIIAGV